MAGAEAVAQAAVELERGARLVLVGSQEWLAAQPAAAPIRATGLPGWVAFVAAGGYFIGTIPTRPEGVPEGLVTLHRQWSRDLEAEIDFLESNELTPEQIARQLEGIRITTDGVRRLRVELERVSATQGAQAPSPTQILRQELSQLRRTVATQETWRRGHHGQVHRPLSVAEAAHAGAEIAMASVLGPALGSVVDAVRAVVEHLLPQLRRELTRLNREEAQARSQGDLKLRVDLRQRASELAERIGDLVRWLRTEALPEVAEQLRAEREARREADRELRRSTERELRRLEETDAGLMQALGPLLGPGLAPVLNAGRKVARTEGMFDQLLRSGDVNWAAQLLAAGPFVALASKVLGRVAGQVPETLAGLEEAAVRALGAVR